VGASWGMYAATGDAVIVLAEDGGRWSARAALEGVGAQSLAVAGDGVVFAGARGTGLWRSADGGRTWASARLPARDVLSVAVSPADGAVYAGCEPSALFRSRDGASEWEELTEMRSVPSAPSWSFPPRPWTSHVRWIAPDPHEADRLLVGIEAGAVLLTEDGGRTWADHRPEADRDPHALAWHPTTPGRAYEAGGGGAAWSHDACRTWQRADEGRDRRYVWGLAVDPSDPDRWWVSAAPGPAQAHRGERAEARIYRWERVWRAVTPTLDAFPYALLVDEGAVYAGLGDGRLLRNADGGDMWSEVRLTGDLPGRIVALAA
jgi:photosystem II stability/assembly factor-like uncharacterized protein